MSKTSWALMVLGALALAAGAWSAGLFDNLTSRLDLDILQDEEAPQAVEEHQASSDLSTGGDMSDEALQEDLNTLDAEISNYSDTSSELEASLADEPVEQDSNL